jgi:hypothetical protein
VRSFIWIDWRASLMEHEALTRPAEQHVSFLVNLYYFRLRTVWRYQSVIRSRKFEKDRKHKGQTRKDKKTNNDPQNTTQKSLNNTNHTTRHDELSFGGRVSASCSISDARQSTWEFKEKGYTLTEMIHLTL